MQSVNSSEGEVYDGGELVLEFKDAGKQTLVINNTVLTKQETMIEAMKWLGEKKTQQQITVNINQFIHQEVNAIKGLIKQLPAAKTGNTRQVSMRSQDVSVFNTHLETLSAALSKQSDDSLPNRLRVDPALAVVYGFKQMELLPEAKQVSAYNDDQGKVGYVFKTCDASVNYEEDVDGQCQTWNVYHPQHIDLPTVMVEVEAHRTCLEDACDHDYYRLEVKQSNNFGWQLSAKSKGRRCDIYRGGGSPPCL